MLDKNSSKTEYNILMLKKLRALRTNENVLIAADVLLSSKTSFMTVFLMAYMMNVSLKSSPVNFIVYNIVRYSIMGLLAVVLIPFFRKHTLVAWRLSMVFSVLEMIAVSVLDSQAWYFTYVLAFCSAAESSLYWRPKMYFDVTEVEDSRRLHFKGRATMLTEVVKIVMPVVLGAAIGSAGYTRTASVILGICTLQLLVSLHLHPKNKRKIKKVHSLSKVYGQLMKHGSLRKIMYIQLIRGFVTCSAAYLVISQVNLYRSTNSDLDLGIYTSLAAIIAILAVLIFHRIKRKSAQKAYLAMFLPALILFPAALILLPHNMLLSVSMYVFMQSIVGGLFDGTVTQTRIQGILSTHLSDDSYRIEVECLGEVALTIGRLAGLVALLALIILGQEENMMWLALFESIFIIPWLALVLPKTHQYN